MLVLNLLTLFLPMIHIAIAFLYPVLIWLVLVSFFLAVCLAVQDGVARLRRLHQVPCSRCAFFTSNHHLKCTVHPCKALSEEAINCLDYESVSSAKPMRSLAKTISKKHLELSRLFSFENS
jgi:hypothetical protein